MVKTMTPQQMQSRKVHFAGKNEDVPICFGLKSNPSHIELRVTRNTKDVTCYNCQRKLNKARYTRPDLQIKLSKIYAILGRNKDFEAAQTIHDAMNRLRELEMLVEAKEIVKATPQQELIFQPPDDYKDDKVFIKIRQLVHEHSGIELNKIKSESRFVADLGEDSLDTVEIIMMIEEEFEMEIPDEDAERISTVGDAVDYVKKRID